MRTAALIIELACLLGAAVAGASAWTPPLPLSEWGPESSRPRIARGSNGAMHIVWLNKSAYDIYYRHRAGNGAWGPAQMISLGSLDWADRADVAEDSLGRAHVFYSAGVSGGNPDLYEVVKTGSTWTTTQFTNTPSVSEDYPRLMPDSLGRLHMVYTTGSSVAYRVWSGGVWSGETIIGGYNGDGNPYYHRPDISVDSNNCLHVVWEPNSTTLVYRKHNGTSWQGQITIATTSGFLSFCAVAHAGPNSIVAVTFDNSQIKYNYSSNGGANWNAYQYLNDGHYPKMDSDTFGNAHLIYEWLPSNYTGYRRWNGSSWTAAEAVGPYTRWQGWPDVAAGTDGTVYAVYDDGDTWAKDLIQFAASQDTDLAGPAPVSPFSAPAGDGTVFLSWTNPVDPDFRGTMIRWSTTGYPATPTGGTLLCSRLASRGSTDSFSHTSLTNGVTYYYSAFSYDLRPNYSTAAHASAMPLPMTCDYAKRQPDTTTVDLKGKIVSAIFSADGCIYITETDRTSGVRVMNNGSGLAVGDVVDVTGTMGTRMLSGASAERQITGPTVFRVSGGTPPAPLGMICKSVGGAGVAPYITGVMGGVGQNNMGLLVKIAGKITKVAGSYLYIDDGSGCVDPNGSVGVMVRCSTTVPTSYVAGDKASATGILEGSIPTGYTQNRRYVRMRDLSDLREF